MLDERPQRGTRWDNILDAVIVVAACAVFLAFALYQLRLPGFYYDEAWDAVSTMKIIQGKPTELDLGANIELFGRQWQLMLNSYQGIISTYLLIPFFLIAGPSVEAVRAMPIMFGVIAIVLLYFLAREWFGRPTARVAVIFLALSPSWIFWSRIGVYVVSEIVPFTLGALLAFTHWWRSKREANWSLWIGCFLIGLGLATKLLYLWPIIALIACYIILHGRELWRHRRLGLRSLRPAWSHSHVSRRNVAITLVGGLVAFCIGSFTFLAYNVETLGTWKKIKSSFFQTDYGANNSTVLPNLHEQLDRFKVLMDGGYFWFQGWAGAVYTNDWMPIAFYAAAAGMMLAIALNTPYSPSRQARTWVLLCLAFIPLPIMLLFSYEIPTERDIWAIGPGLAAVLLAAVAGAWLLRAALVRPSHWARPAGIILLAVVLVSGAAWGRNGAPDGTATHGLDLRMGDLPGLAFWLALVALMALYGWGQPVTRWQRPAVASITFLAAILGQSFSTLSGLWPTHLLVMVPIPQLVVAAGVVGIPAAIRRISARKAPEWLAFGVATLVVAQLAAADLNVDLSYQRDLTRSGGYFAFSDAIYDLADYVESQQPRQVVAVEWGIRRQLQILSAGAVEPEEIFQYQFGAAPPEFYAAVDQTLRDPKAMYLFTTGDVGPYNRFNDFKTYLAKKGLQPVLEHESRQRDSKTIYEAYHVQKLP